METLRQVLVVGVAEYRVSADSAASLVTYALGSCVCVAIHDPVARVAGLLHFMLPERCTGFVHSSEEPQDDTCRYADSGTPLLFREAYKLGADKQRLRVMLAGGAAVFDDQGIFSIGRRNVAAVKRILWKAGVIIHAEDTGGSQSRTVRLEVATGRLFINTPGEGARELAPKSPRFTRGGSLCPAGC